MSQRYAERCQHVVNLMSSLNRTVTLLCVLQHASHALMYRAGVARSGRRDMERTM